MTLLDIIARNAHMFYAQSWFLDEAFMGAEADTSTPLPLRIAPGAQGYVGWPPAVNTATLAWLFVQHPTDRMWERYLWTSDTDRHGQRVFVGDNGQGLEIHRHLHMTERWGVPVW